MINSIDNNYDWLSKKIPYFDYPNIPLIILVIIFCTGCFLTDNATKLAYQLESASKKLKSQKNGSEIIIHYETEDSKAPFTILILPENGVTSDELYQKGLDSNVLKKII
jgi:hypothetical protein